VYAAAMAIIAWHLHLGGDPKEKAMRLIELTLSLAAPIDSDNY
jgi:hypothetical protein